MTHNSIAVIAMAGRFPGANTLEEFWRNLESGSVARRQYTDEELLREGIAPHLLRDVNYVKAGYPIDDVALFDAEFFRMSPREAAITDPQQRLFLECVWTALETAGYDPARYPGDIGLYAGSKMNSYLLNNLHAPGSAEQSFDSFELLLGNDKDYLTSRVSYKLNLKGPSIVIQTACSSSLVAVHYACEALLSGDCDMAIAGGVSVRVPVHAGYYFQKGAILSPDGFCRAYSEDANGTVEGNGVGAVVLKRLADAVADGDRILAVVRGSAVNNDGSEKVGFTAPSGEGQRKVIAEALSVADVDPTSITLVEGHGTGTPLGDPIEVAALAQVYRNYTDMTGYCALGSVKASIGHLDTAAGIASFIKVILALQHGRIPPAPNYSRPNPQLGLEHSPFYVPNVVRQWESATTRIAGVTSLGIGGTNCHVIVEEAPAPAAADGTHLDWHVLTLAARSPAAVREMAHNLATHLEQNSGLALADVAWTLLEGRREFPYRRVVLCRDLAEAIRGLRADTDRLIIDAQAESVPQPFWIEIAALTGDSLRRLAVYCGKLPALANELRKLEAASPHLALSDALTRLTGGIALDEKYMKSKDGQLLQFSLLTVLARWLMSVGLSPQAWFGYEPVCAFVTGSLSLEDACRRVSSEAAATIQSRAEPPPAALVIRLGGSQVCGSYGGARARAAHSSEQEADPGLNLMRALASAWVTGVQIASAMVYQNEKRRRVPLPTYPFEYQRHWVDSSKVARVPPEPADGIVTGATAVREPPSQPPASGVQYYIPTWAQMPTFRMDLQRRFAGKRVLVIGDRAGPAGVFARRLQHHGCAPVQVERDTAYRKVSDSEYFVDATAAHDYYQCLEELAAAEAFPHYVLYFTRASQVSQDSDELANFWELTALVQGIGRARQRDLTIAIVTQDALGVFNAGVQPGQSIAECFVKSVPLEYPQLNVKLLDMDGRVAEQGKDHLLDLVLDDLAAPVSNVLAYRNDTRWRKGVQAVSLACPAESLADVRGGAYLLSGGLGAIALQLCTYLAARGPCKLILLAKNDARSATAQPQTQLGLEAFSAGLRSIERRLQKESTDTATPQYEQFAVALKELCAAYVIDFIKSHRQQFEAGGEYDEEDLVSLITPQVRFRKYVKFLLRTLAETGVMACRAGKASATAEFHRYPPVGEVRARLLDAYPQFVGLLDLLSHCTAHYPALFAGEVEPLKVLYPDGTGKLFERAYQTSARHGSHHQYSRLLLEFVVLYRKQRPADKVRILEIGGGGGNLTRTLLPTLMQHDVEYCFTDISMSFVREAQAMARQYGLDKLSFARFDITKDAQAQGFDSDSFDIIVGLDVVHATPDIAQTLKGLCGLLKSGGALGLVETTRDDLWLTTLMGLTDGWWAFQDDRDASPLLSQAAWRRKLDEVQLGQFAVFPEAPSSAEVDCSLILLQKPHEGDDSDVLKARNRYRQLQKLRELGAEVTVLRADVSNRTELSAALQSLGAKRLEIDGVIHTAGVVDGKLFQHRTREDIEEVLAPKVAGIRNLYREFQDRPLSMWVNCSSIVAVNGGVGQFAHCAANRYLDDFTAYLRRHGQPNAISIDWEAWREIGQAEESMRRFHRQMTDRFSTQRSPRGGLLSWSDLSDARYTVYETRFSQSDWFLSGHRLRGESVLPGTVCVELLVEAVKTVYGDKAIELSDLNFVLPLFVEARGSVKVLTVLARGEQHHDVMILSVQENLEQARLHVTGRARVSPVQSTVTFDLADLEERCTGTALDERIEDNDARWKCLSRAVCDDNKGLAEVKLPDAYADEAASYHLHPAMLDVAIAFLPLQFRRISAFVPVHYKKLVAFAPLSSHMFSFARLGGGATAESQSLELNVTLLDPSGRRLVDVEKLTLRRVSTATDVPSDSSRESQQLRDFLQSVQSRSAAWLTPQQGAEAFERILASGLPQVIATNGKLAGSLAERIAPHDERERQTRSDARMPVNIIKDLMKARPSLSSEYIRAGSRTEKSLAAIWSSVLGIGAVGIDDNFFELGGDSLLAIQVSSMVGSELGVEVPSGLLFEFPTVKKFAQFVEGRLSEAEAEMQPANAGVAEEGGGDMSAIDRLVSDIRKKLSED